ncbi:hypothetical protein D9M72_643100 [compost metagenome]
MQVLQVHGPDGVLQVPQGAAGTDSGKLVIIAQRADDSAVLFSDRDGGREQLRADHSGLIKENHVPRLRDDTVRILHLVAENK